MESCSPSSQLDHCTQTAKTGRWPSRVSMYYSFWACIHCSTPTNPPLSEYFRLHSRLPPPNLSSAVSISIYHEHIAVLVWNIDARGHLFGACLSTGKGLVRSSISLWSLILHHLSLYRSMLFQSSTAIDLSFDSGQLGERNSMAGETKKVSGRLSLAESRILPIAAAPALASISKNTRNSNRGKYFSIRNARNVTKRWCEDPIRCPNELTIFVHESTCSKPQIG